MNQNQFVVDLGDLKLTARQRSDINKAVQIAASIELAKIKGAENAKSLSVENGKIGIRPPVKFPPKFPPFIYGKIIIPRKRIGIWEMVGEKEFEALQKL